MNEPREVLPEELARRAAAAGSMDALKASGAFDELMAQIDSGQLELDGKDGFIQQLIKASLERGLQAERAQRGLSEDAGNVRRRGGPGRSAGPGRFVHAASGSQGRAPDRRPG
jgi:hypothetical protein